MPNEAKQDRDGFGDQARQLYHQARAAGDGESSQGLALSSIAASLLNLGSLLEKWAQPRLAIPPEAGPPEEEKVWYVGKSSITNEAWPGLEGPFTKAEAIQRLREKGYQ